MKRRFWDGWMGGIGGSVVMQSVSHYHIRSDWTAIGVAVACALTGGLAAVVFGPNGRR